MSFEGKGPASVMSKTREWNERMGRQHDEHLSLPRAGHSSATVIRHSFVRASFGRPISRKSQRGFVISAEAMLFVSILVLGTTIGWVTIRDAANAELFDVANAITHNVVKPYFSDPDRGSPPEELIEQTFTLCLPSFPDDPVDSDGGTVMDCP